MDDRTVVGWNGGADPTAAIDWAVEREQSRHGTVALVRVVPDSRSVDDYHAAMQVLDSAQRDLNVQAARLKAAAAPCFVTTTIVRGDPEDELLRYTAPGIVLAVPGARHERHNRAGGPLGVHLAATAHGPVVVVPHRPPVTRGPVVVGVDGSAESQLALDTAGEEARLRDAELVLLHAWQEPVMVAEEYTVDARLGEAVEAQGALILDVATERASSTNPSVPARRLLIHGPPESALLEIGRSARLIVMGSRHLRGIRRLILGSVSHGVVTALPCPVMVVGLGPPTATGPGGTPQ